jgi:hypothetical protein
MRTPERRRNPRISPKGTAMIRLVRSEQYQLQGRIANISQSGLLVVTRTTAPERLLGARLDVSLRFDNAAAQWFEVGAQIVRIGANSIAMSLLTMPAGVVEIIEEAMNGSIRNDRMLTLVLVDATEWRRVAMAEAFRSGGCTVIDVATPLEAIVRLGESRFEPDLIAVADSQPAAISDEIRRFVEAEHSKARLVTINDATTAPEGLKLWLSSANPDADLAARIRHVLVAIGHGNV